MIVVDTTVWADWFNGAQTPEVDRLDGALTAQDAGLTPLILTEVLQGFRADLDIVVVDDVRVDVGRRQEAEAQRRLLALRRRPADRHEREQGDGDSQLKTAERTGHRGPPVVRPGAGGPAHATESRRSRSICRGGVARLGQHLVGVLAECGRLAVEARAPVGEAEAGAFEAHRAVARVDRLQHVAVLELRVLDDLVDCPDGGAQALRPRSAASPSSCGLAGQRAFDPARAVTCSVRVPVLEARVRRAPRRARSPS